MACGGSKLSDAPYEVNVSKSSPDVAYEHATATAQTVIEMTTISHYELPLCTRELYAASNSH
jgi:hypothetical protein